jgi:hypothetical protein
MNMFSGRGGQTIYMKDNKGNVWKETNYEGYGDFGGKDFYELLAEMNGLESCRYEGISLCHDADRPFFAPNLVTDPDWRWRDVKPKDHEGQGQWWEDEDE